MSTAAAITAIGSCLGIEFSPHKVLTSCTTMTTSAEDPDIIYEICFLHWLELPQFANIVPRLL
jgi:hypothetical protein